MKYIKFILMQVFIISMFAFGADKQLSKCEMAPAAPPSFFNRTSSILQIPALQSGDKEEEIKRKSAISDYDPKATKKMWSAINENNITDLNSILSTGKADVNDISNGRFHWSPLKTAAIFDRPELVNILLVYGADPSKEDNDRDYVSTPLHSTVHKVFGTPNQIDIIHALLHANNTILDKKDSEGDTALMIAVRKENEDAVKALLEYDPDITITTNREEDALSIAKEQKNTAIIELLMDYIKKQKNKLLNFLPR